MLSTFLAPDFPMAYVQKELRQFSAVAPAAGGRVVRKFKRPSRRGGTTAQLEPEPEPEPSFDPDLPALSQALKE